MGNTSKSFENIKIYFRCLESYVHARCACRSTRESGSGMTTRDLLSMLDDQEPRKGTDRVVECCQNICQERVHVQDEPKIPDQHLLWGS